MYTFGTQLKIALKHFNFYNYLSLVQVWRLTIELIPSSSVFLASWLKGRKIKLKILCEFSVKDRTCGYRCGYFSTYFKGEVRVAFNHATLAGHDWSPVALTPFPPPGGTQYKKNGALVGNWNLTKPLRDTKILFCRLVCFPPLRGSNPKARQ